jgi:hypothetical protein
MSSLVRSWLKLAALTSAAPLLSACAGPTVVVDVRFPSQTAFIASSLVDFDFVPLSPSDLGRCPALVADAVGDIALGASVSIAGVPRCDVRRGVTLPDPGSGPHAFVVQAVSPMNATLLVGCAVGEAYPGGQPIRVDLYPTEAYAAAASAVPPGSTVDGACP